MRLLVLESGSLVSEVVCGEEAVYIGSREGCRIQLPDSRIAAQQAVIFPEKHSQWVVQQLHPENTIQLNGSTIGDKATLKTGDEIQILGFVIRAFPEYKDAPTAQPAGRSTSVAQLAKFVQYQLPPGALVKKPDETLVVQPAQIARIGQANLVLGQCTQVEALMDICLQLLLETFAAQRVWMGVRRVNYGSMEYVEGRTLRGETVELPEVGDKLKPRVLDRAQFVLLPRADLEGPCSALVGPLAGPDGTLGMVYMDTGESDRRFTEAEFDFFILLTSLFAVQLDAIFKIIAHNRQALIDGEVSVAHLIQSRLTPRKLPQWDRLQFGAFRETGRDHTGDIYDLVRLPNKMAAFMVAHTEAVGPVPSMLIAQSQAAFRFGAMHMDAPHVLLKTINHMMYDGETDHPLNCFVGVVDPETGEMRYAMAGKTGAYVIGQRGEERRLGPAEPTPALGAKKNTVYPLYPDQLQPREPLAIYTPGVTTATNRNNAVFGEERFINILCDGFGQLASNMLKEMLNDLRSFTEGGTQPNDITVLMAHRSH